MRWSFALVLLALPFAVAQSFSVQSTASDKKFYVGKEVIAYKSGWETLI